MKHMNDAASERTDFRQMRHLAVLIALAALLFLPCPAHSYSYYETQTVPLGSASGHYSLELWHHSGGYWKVRDGAGKLIKLRDRLIEQAGIVGYLNATHSARWSIPLPERIRAALREGRKVSAAVKENADLYVGSQCAISGSGTVEVYAIPRFHIATSATLNSFVPGINVTIPLVSSGYGRNIYAIYGILCAGEPGLGYFSNAQPSKVVEPFIHPSLITNRLGWLKPGSTINIRGRAVSSTGHTVGVLTLAGGGAVGLHFDFPITVDFFEEVERLVTVEEPVGNTTAPDLNGTEASEAAVSQEAGSGLSRQAEDEVFQDQPPDAADPEDPSPPEGGGNNETENDAPGPGPAEDPPQPPAFDPRDYLLHRVF